MPELPTPPVNPPSQPEQPQTKRFSKKALLIMAGGIGILVLVIIIVLLSKTQEKRQAGAQISPAPENSNATNSNKFSDNKTKSSMGQTLNTLIYGSWKDNHSVISALDVNSGKTVTIASLPFNIKKVSVLSPQQLIYIDQTNEEDHGKQINILDLKEKTVKTSIKASTGYGIDDYILSNNKQYMAIWELQLAPGTKVLQGGRSRVYAVKLSNPNSKALIYDEEAVSPIHYPRAILGDGRIVSDKFRPNDPQGGAGWAYGMSVSDFNGGNKKDLDNMQEGSYGTKPSLSPDGKYLVFSGYDGANGDGKQITEGFRQAILTPNTVELLDLNTFERIKLSNIPNSDLYISSEWDKSTDNIIISTISKVQERDGLFSYNMLQKKMKKLNIPENDKTTYSYVTHLTDNNLLIGITTDSETSVGNLGDGYAASLSNLYNFDVESNKAFSLPLENPFVQYISVLPSNYFSGVLGAQVLASESTPPVPQPTFIDLYSNLSDKKQNLQLYTFAFKTALTEKRQEQQSDPIPTPTLRPTIPPRGVTPPPARVLPTHTPFVIPKTINCRELADAQCAKGWNHAKCRERVRLELKEQGKCNQSPLYIYGPTGQDITVRVQTTVYNDLPKYNGVFDIKLLPDGLMEVNNNNYDAINYDYKSNARKLTAPTHGTIAAKSNIEKVLRDYAKKLGLNSKETNDLVKYGKEKIKSDYVFISFFDHVTSTRILPLSFDPQPDNYLNVVFYFKQLEEEPNYSVSPPVFPAPVKRGGLTAVEVSEIVE